MRDTKETSKERRRWWLWGSLGIAGVAVTALGIRRILNHSSVYLDEGWIK